MTTLRRELRQSFLRVLDANALSAREELADLLAAAALEVAGIARRAKKANEYPEVALFRRVTKRYPPSVNYEDVARSVRAVGARLGHEAWEADLLPFFKAWCGKGYNPGNLSWLEWAETGQIPVNGNWKPRHDKNMDILRDFTERNG